MQHPYFYEEHITADDKTFVLSEQTSKHCAQVLRMRTGEKLYLVNGKGLLAKASITAVDKKNTLVDIETTEVYAAPDKKTHIAISLLKNTARFEWFVEKAVEIGVHTITPLICERTEKTHFRKDRMKQITVSAMLQSRRTYLTQLNDSIEIKHWLQNVEDSAKFIAHCENSAKKLLSEYCPLNNDAVILIGPEGDFTTNEIEMAFNQGFKPVSLGDTRLRTETAGVYSAVLLSI